MRSVKVGLTTLRVEIPSPSLPQSPVPRPLPQGTPEARPSPILRRLSRPRYTALYLAAGRSGRAAAACWGRRKSRGQGVAAGRGCWGGHDRCWRNWKTAVSLLCICPRLSKPYLHAD